MRSPRSTAGTLTLLGVALLVPMVTRCQAQDPQGSGGALAHPGVGQVDVRVETVAEGLEHPWALAFLPDGRILVTERPGRLRIVAPDGKLSPPARPACPEVARAGPGRAARRGRRPRLRENRLRLPVLRRAGRRRSGGRRSRAAG